MSEGLEVVNVVGSGEFDLELDLEALACDLGNVAEYNPSKHTGMHIRLSNEALVTLYRTGSYHIVGIELKEELFETRKELVERLQRLDLQFNLDTDEFGVRNIVCTGDYGESVNLNALTIGFGLERTEYEPEQFPGLVYRPSNFDAVVLLFGSGKLVITGLTSLGTAYQAFNSISSEIDRLSS